MSIFFGEEQMSGQATARAAARPRGLAEEISAGFEAHRRVTNLNKLDVIVPEQMSARLDAIEKAVGVRPPDPFKDDFDEVDERAIHERWRPMGRAGVVQARREIDSAKRAALEARISKLQAANPDRVIDAGPAAFERGLREKAQGYEQTLGEIGLIPNLVSGVGASFTSPVEASTAFIGGGSKTILGAMLREAGINLTLEAVATPQDQADRERLGLETGGRVVAQNLAGAALFGGVVGGAVKGGEIAWGKLSKRAALDVVDALPAEAITPEIRLARNALEKELVDIEAAALTDEAEIAALHRETIDALEAELELGARPLEIEGEPGVAAPNDARAPAAFEAFRPEEISVDARRMQFKSGGDDQGVTDALRGVKKWDDLKAGTIIVWEDAAGRRFVADGHQRVGLAKRLAAEGQEVTLYGHVLRASDGVSDADARAFAAGVNIARGTGTAIDAAKVLKARPDLLDGALNPRAAFVRQARGLMRLGDDAFGMAVNEVVQENYAAIVGELIDDAAEQVAVMGLIARQNPASAAEAEALVRAAKAAGFETATQENLFGADVAAEAMLGHRATVLGRAVSQLRRDKRIFATLEREAADIEAAGNRLDSAANREIAQNAEQIAETVLKTAHVAGPVADALGRAAKRLADTGKPGPAVRQFIDELRALGPETLRGLDDRRGGLRGQRGEPGIAGAGGRAEAASPDLTARSALDDFDEPRAGAELQNDQLTDDLFGGPIENYVKREADAAKETAAKAGGETKAKEPQPEKPDPDEEFLVGETVDKDGNVIPEIKTRRQLEKEFEADEDMIERLKGCVKK